MNEIQKKILINSIIEESGVNAHSLKNYNYVFFGSARFSSIFLKTLASQYFLPKIVVCNPDKPIGRKKIVTPPQIKIFAQENNIDATQPKNKEELENIAKIYQKNGAELGIVAAYSKIIPKSLIDAPTYGTWGIHPSLLPKYRGATPIQSALLAGEIETGVTIYQMDEAVDHGPILYQLPVKILPADNYLSLEEKLAINAVVAFLKTVQVFIEKKDGVPEIQNHETATFTKKFTTADGAVDIIKNLPLEIYRKIQALNPEPGVFTLNYPSREGQRVKLLEAKEKTGQITITKIHPAGKNPTEANLALK